MLKFLRISTIYPEAIKIIENEINFEKNINYNKLLSKVLNFGFGESNKITKELKKKKYVCNEIIANLDVLQKKWVSEYSKYNIHRNTILNQIMYYKPDIIYFGNSNILDKEIFLQIKKLKHLKLIIIFHCSPITKKIEKNLYHADILITCTDGYKNKISKIVKKKTFKINHAFNYLDKNYEDFKKRNIDITFVGSLYIKSGLHINRINLVYDLLKNFKNTYISINFSIKNFFQLILVLFNFRIGLSLFKKLEIIYKVIFIYIFSQKAVYGEQMFQILKKSKILINSHIEDTKYAGNMRLFEGTALGCLVLTDKKLGLNKLFKLNEEIIVYNNLNHLIKKCKYYLNNLYMIKKIANKGKKRSIRSHTYKSRASDLDKIIKKNLANK